MKLSLLFLLLLASCEVKVPVAIIADCEIQCKNNEGVERLVTWHGFEASNYEVECQCSNGTRILYDSERLNKD